MDPNLQPTPTPSATTTDTSSTDVIKIKDDLIEKLKNDIIDLKTQVAMLQNDKTNLQIELATNKAITDSQTTVSAQDKIDSEYTTSDDIIAEMAQSALSNLKGDN